MRILLLTLIAAVFLSSLAVCATNSENRIPTGYFSLNDAEPSLPERASTNMAPVASNPVPATALIDPHNFVPMTGGAKFRFYLHSTYGPLSIFSSMASAGFNQERNSMPEWGQGMEGYGKRFGSSIGQKAVEHTARLGLQYLMHEDPRYFASGRSGLWRRGFYAIGQTFVAHKDAGGTRPGYSYLAGLATGIYVSRQWYPADEQTTEKYIQESVTSVGLRAAKNILKEFWPDLKRRLKR